VRLCLCVALPCACSLGSCCSGRPQARSSSRRRSYCQGGRCHSLETQRSLLHHWMGIAHCFVGRLFICTRIHFSPCTRALCITRTLCTTVHRSFIAHAVGTVRHRVGSAAGWIVLKLPAPPVNIKAWLGVPPAEETVAAMPEPLSVSRSWLALLVKVKYV
jgi:hypothetical protein